MAGRRCSAVQAALNGGTFGGITFSGNGKVNLTAPTSGAYAGVLIGICMIFDPQRPKIDFRAAQWLPVYLIGMGIISWLGQFPTKGEGGGVPGMVLDDHLTVACGEGAVRILELQRAGRQIMKADEFLRGTRVAAGTRLG